MSYGSDLGRRSGTLAGAQTLADTVAGILNYDLSAQQGRNTLCVIVTVSKAATLTMKFGRGAGSLGVGSAADSSLPHTITEALAVASGESYPITRIFPLPAIPSCSLGSVDLSNASGSLDYTLDFGARAY